MSNGEKWALVYVEKFRTVGWFCYREPLFISSGRYYGVYPCSPPTETPVLWVSGSEIKELSRLPDIEVALLVADGWISKEQLSEV